MDQAQAGSGAVTVRLATPADVEEMARVHVSSWQGAYRGHVPDSFLDALSPAQRVPLWSKIVVDPNSVALVGLVDRALVGLCSQLPARDHDANPGSAEISALYVDPLSWGRGVGRALIDAAVAACRERHFHELTLWVIVGNARARRFYEGFGFVADGHEKTEQRVGFSLHELRYRRPIEA